MHTTTTPPAPTSALSDSLRARLVHNLLRQVGAGETHEGTALLILDVLGLTGDREALEDAVDATRMLTDLADGVADPWQVEPELRCGRDEAQAWATRLYKDRLDEAVLVLARRGVV